MSSSLIIVCIFSSLTLCWPIFLSWISEKSVNIYEEYKERRKTLRKLYFLKKMKWKWGFVNLLFIIWGNLREGLNQGNFKLKWQKQPILFKFLQTDKKLLFYILLFVMSCIFTLCVSCKAAFCVKSSTCKLFCFMGICQLQSNLIMPSSKNQRFGFFWKTFCPIPGPLIGFSAWLVLHRLLVYWFHHLHVFDKPINVFKPVSDVSMKLVD